MSIQPKVYTLHIIKMELNFRVRSLYLSATLFGVSVRYLSFIIAKCKLMFESGFVFLLYYKIIKFDV